MGGPAVGGVANAVVGSFACGDGFKVQMSKVRVHMILKTKIHCTLVWYVLYIHDMQDNCTKTAVMFSVYTLYPYLCTGKILFYRLENWG